MVELALVVPQFNVNGARQKPACGIRPSRRTSTTGHVRRSSRHESPSDPTAIEVGERIASDFPRTRSDLGYSPEAEAREGDATGGLAMFEPIRAFV